MSLDEEIQVIELLSQDLTEANHDLRDLNEMFPEDQSEIDLLNKTSPQFFTRMKHIYYERLVLFTTRMTDPFKQGGYKNISIQTIHEYAKSNNWNSQNSIARCISEINSKKHFFSKARSKFLCHRSHDELTNSGKAEIQLDDIEFIFERIEKCIDLARKELNMNARVHHYSNREGVRRLKYYLKLGYEKHNEIWEGNTHGAK